MKKLSPMYSDEVKYNFHREMKCNVRRLEYDYETLTGILHFPEGNCTDMEGAIRTFLRIDSQVSSVYTFSGGKLDTVYIQEGKEWKARSFGSFDMTKNKRSGKVGVHPDFDSLKLNYNINR